ncbi:glycosyl transferase [Bacteroidia bacterium]|nr:glycosyl transferase [Bacteroidia bacterium]GHV70746.1 glycosyl transferase [Bacteroidia bacterium]
MNILLINDYLERGGAEAVFKHQFEILKKDYTVEMFYAFKGFSDKNTSPFSYIYSFHFKKKLEQFLSGHSFDCIIIHNYNGALSPSVLDVLHQYKKNRKCKIIHYAHDFHLVCPNRGYSYFKNGRTINFQKPPTLLSFLTKRLDYRGAAYSMLKKCQWMNAYTLGKKQKVFDLILTPSDFLAQQISLLYPGINVERMYNSCNSLNIKGKEKTKEKSGKLRLVYFGRLVQEKGLADFIEAIRFSTIDFSFTMIGEGEEEPVIQDIIKQHKLQEKVFIKPRMNHADLFAELSNYDVFVLPSLWYENAPLSVIEAASVGLGLFLSGHGGVLEMGEICKASHFFKPGHPDDIVSKLDTLYKDFLNGSMPQADKDCLPALFSEETYIENLKKILNI